MKKGLFFIFFLIIGVVVFVDVRFSILSPIRSVVFTLSAPVFNSFSSLGSNAKGFLNNFSNAKQCAEDLEDVKNENANLIAKAVKLQELQNENNILRQQLAIAKSEDIVKVLGNIVEVSNGSFLLDKGTNDGIKEGMVAVSNGVFWGRVISASKSYSFLQFIGDQGMSLEVIDSQSQVKNLFKDTKLSLITKDMAVASGDTIVTVGDETTPPNIAVGIIKEVVDNPLSPYKEVSVSILAQKQVKEVFVLLWP